MKGNVETLKFLVPSLENKKEDQKMNQIADQIIYEMKDYLTMVKGYQQLVSSKNPEIQKIEYWDQITENIDAMVKRLFVYEDCLHKKQQGSY